MNGGAEVVIGARDPDYNSRQYNKYAGRYTRSNPQGLRGGLTPLERVAELEQVAPQGTPIFEPGFGMGLDADVLEQRHRWKGGDICWAYIEKARAKGRDAIYFDAGRDPVPEGFGAIYAHISLIHIRPQALARFLTSARENLQKPKAGFFSFLDGYGHERSARNEGFPRDFFYYSEKRLAQIFEQEGFDAQLKKVVAFNNTVFWHAIGRFKEDYQGGSYGEKNLHPFGDVFWTPEPLFKGKNPIHELMEAQAKAELLKPEIIKKVKRLEDLFTRGIIGNAGELGRAINTTWADGLTGQNIEDVMLHAEKHFAKYTHRHLTEAAFAVCNNNGFKNILTGPEPSWLLEIIAKQLKIDYLSSAQWGTESETQFTGRLNGKVFYPKNNADLGRPAASYEDRLRGYLGPQFRRITIGVGHTPKDDNLLEVTDYPVYAYPDKATVHAAHRKGVFTTADGQHIYAGHTPCLRWQHSEEIKELIGYLNSITSGRFPVEPDPQFKGRLWKCPDNSLNEDFYRANKIPVHIL